jgi:cytochrome c biogenesis protein
LSVLMSYVSHSQVWALLENETLYLGGRTNRGQILFERELVEVVSQLQSETLTVKEPQTLVSADSLDSAA